MTFHSAGADLHRTAVTDCVERIGAGKPSRRTCACAEFEGPGRAGLVCDLDGAVLDASSASVGALIGDRVVSRCVDGRILAGTTRH